MTDPFATPGSTSRMDYNQLNGKLLLVEPHKLEEGVSTSLGVKDAIRADVTILDGPTAGASFYDTLIFPRVLIGQLRSRLGQKVLGRLGQGVANPGQSPPWTLSRATDADTKIGVAYLASGVVDADLPPF